MLHLVLLFVGRGTFFFLAFVVLVEEFFFWVGGELGLGGVVGWLGWVGFGWLGLVGLVGFGLVGWPALFVCLFGGLVACLVDWVLGTV